MLRCPVLEDRDLRLSDKGSTSALSPLPSEFFLQAAICLQVCGADTLQKFPSNRACIASYGGCDDATLHRYPVFFESRIFPSANVDFRFRLSAIEFI